MIPRLRRPIALRRLARSVSLALAAGLAITAAASADAPASAAPGAGRLWVSPADVPGAGPEALRWRARRNAVNAAKLGLCLAGAGVLAWGAVLDRRSKSGGPTGPTRAASRRRAKAGSPSASDQRARRSGKAAKLRDGLLAGLGAAGFLGWWNFGLFHYPDPSHPHEIVHHVLGARYFPELGYTRLYECIAVADAEAGLRPRVEARLMTDLETYQLRDTRAVLADPERCRRHFAPERWTQFAADTAWLRARVHSDAWEALQRDHGYNPSPAWGVLGRSLLGGGPLDEARLSTLLLLDPALLVLMWILAAQSFGWRATCVALLYFGANHPAEYGWTGGSYLRHDWLAASVAGICLLRRGQPVAAGVCLGAAALLRVFPVLFLAPVAIEAVRRLVTGGRAAVGREPRRLLVGVAAVAAVAIPLSLAIVGPRAWADFAAHMARYAAAPGSNAVGLAPLLSFDPAAREARLTGSDLEASRAWKAARAERLAERRIAFALIALGCVALTAIAARRRDGWIAVILGIGLVPALLSPASYYTSALLAYGFLWTRRPAVGVLLPGLGAAGWAAAAASLHFDEVFAWTSAAVLVFGVTAAALFVRPDPAGPEARA
jgi:hypothetical protein